MEHTNFIRNVLVREAIIEACMTAVMCREGYYAIENDFIHV